MRPPPGVAQRVDHRRPQLQAPQAGILRVVAPRLLPDGRADLLDQVGVPRAGQADGLREHGSLRRHDVPAVVDVGGPGDAVQRLGAGLEQPDAEPLHRGLVLVEPGDLLRRGETAKQVVDAPVQRERGVAEGILGGRSHGAGEWMLVGRAGGGHAQSQGECRRGGHRDGLGG
ncbi:hypothetical protein GCM10018952_74610 [Streptosporangium vulgare]